MSRALDHGKARRLAKLAAMFSSSHDGERAAAARKFDEALKAEGLSLGDVLAIGSRPVRVAAPQPQVAGGWLRRPPHQMQADLCFASLDLTDWERRFLATVRTRTRPSDKEAAILAGLYGRAMEAARG